MVLLARQAWDYREGIEVRLEVASILNLEYSPESHSSWGSKDGVKLRPVDTHVLDSYYLYHERSRAEKCTKDVITK